MEIYSNKIGNYIWGEDGTVEVGDIYYYADKNNVTKIKIVRIEKPFKDSIVEEYQNKVNIYFEPKVDNDDGSGLIFQSIHTAHAFNKCFTDKSIRCPKNGSFIAYKQVFGPVVITTAIAVLEIPEDARRITTCHPEGIYKPTGRTTFTFKCRSDKAKVLRIESIDESKTYDYGFSKYQRGSDSQCLYKPGEMVYADEFDSDTENDCSHGIHFFMRREDAVNY